MQCISSRLINALSCERDYTGLPMLWLLWHRYTRCSHLPICGRLSLNQNRPSGSIAGWAWLTSIMLAVIGRPSKNVDLQFGEIPTFLCCRRQTLPTCWLVWRAGYSNVFVYVLNSGVPWGTQGRLPRAQKFPIFEHSSQFFSSKTGK